MSPEWSGRCRRRISPLLLKNRRGETHGTLSSLSMGDGVASLANLLKLGFKPITLTARQTPWRAARLGKDKTWRPAAWLSRSRYPRPSARRQDCARHEYADLIRPLSRRRADHGRSHHRTPGFQPRHVQQRAVEHGRQEASGAGGRRRDTVLRFCLATGVSGMRGDTKVIEYLNKALRHELTAVN